MPQPGENFGRDDPFGQRGFIPGGSRQPSTVNTNAHWMAAAESGAKPKGYSPL